MIPRYGTPREAGRRYTLRRGAYAILWRDGRVLLTHQDEPWPEFQLPGGGIDPGESPLRALHREVFEETGIRIGGVEVPVDNLRDWQLSNSYEIYPVWRHRYAPGVTRNTEHVFGLCVPRDIPITLAPREHLQHRWLPWREAADLCFSPSNAEALLQLPRHVDPRAA